MTPLHIRTLLKLISGWIAASTAKSLDRVTPKSVVAKTVRDIPPCFADLVVTIDGHLMKKRIHVYSGFSKGRSVALIADSAPF